MYAIRAADVAEAVAWLDTVDPSVDVPEIRLHAITRGPSARPPVVPIEVERRAAKSAGNQPNVPYRSKIQQNLER
jgi:hypothetical protein